QDHFYTPCILVNDLLESRAISSEIALINFSQFLYSRERTFLTTSLITYKVTKYNPTMTVPI
ncbi:MAG: hypothetical protein NTZ60_02180, partial [Campylobacterales bacterium]|nr:hypothetical protein [Campylobacterales bacterium]